MADPTSTPIFPPIGESFSFESVADNSSDVNARNQHASSATTRQVASNAFSSINQEIDESNNRPDPIAVEFTLIEIATQVPSDSLLDRMRHYPSATKFGTYPLNRYPDVLPTESSRVILSGSGEASEENIDPNRYINANHIGLNGGQYIATQAPLKTTFYHFWKMAVTSASKTESTIIVMLTRLTENNRVKAEQYWPDKGNTLILNLNQRTITVFNQTSEATTSEHSTIIREFSVEARDKEGNLSRRKITQFHFTGWPDHGVADSSQLIALIQRVHKAMESSQSTPIIHCSAGIGRAGTFITSLDLFRRQKKGENLPVTAIGETVRMLREQRSGSVQTPEQYALIHTIFKKLAGQMATISSGNLEGNNSPGQSANQPMMPNQPIIGVLGLFGRQQSNQIQTPTASAPPVSHNQPVVGVFGLFQPVMLNRVPTPPSSNSTILSTQTSTE